MVISSECGAWNVEPLVGCGNIGNIEMQSKMLNQHLMSVWCPQCRLNTDILGCKTKWSFVHASMGRT